MSGDGSTPNLADILRQLTASSAASQGSSVDTSPSENLYSVAAGTQQNQPWQPANEAWRPPQQQQNVWQPPQNQYQQPNQNTWTPPQNQSYSQPSYQQQYQPPQNQYVPLPNPHLNKPQPPPQPAHDPHHVARQQTQRSQQSKPADMIITWPEGLKHIMSLVHTNNTIIAQIKHLMKTQDSHETQWFAGRQKIELEHRKRVMNVKLQQSKARAEKLKNDAAGESAGTGGEDAILRVSDEDLANDLKTQLEVYDAKVYRAQHQMVKEFTVKLRNMGVPFFGTRMELVVIPPKSGTATPEGDAGQKNGEMKQVGDGKVEGKVTEKELVELQRKMLEILEGLCGS